MELTRKLLQDQLDALVQRNRQMSQARETKLTEADNLHKGMFTTSGAIQLLRQQLAHIDTDREEIVYGPESETSEESPPADLEVKPQGEE